MSELSTGWKLPSVSDTATSTTGKPSGPARQIGQHALFHGRNVLLRHHAAADPVVEPETLAARLRPDFDMDIGEFAMAARLLLVAGVLARRAGDGFR